MKQAGIDCHRSRKTRRLFSRWTTPGLLGRRVACKPDGSAQSRGNALRMQAGMGGTIDRRSNGQPWVARASDQLRPRRGARATAFSAAGGVGAVHRRSRALLAHRTHTGGFYNLHVPILTEREEVHRAGGRGSSSQGRRRVPGGSTADRKGRRVHGTGRRRIAAGKPSVGKPIFCYSSAYPRPPAGLARGPIPMRLGRFEHFRSAGSGPCVHRRASGQVGVAYRKVLDVPGRPRPRSGECSCKMKARIRTKAQAPLHSLNMKSQSG